MGKIYDALEKAKKEKTATVDVAKSSVVKFYEKTGPREKQVNILKPLELDVNASWDLVTYSDPQSMESEMFKILRGNILFPAEGTPPRSILVTSAVPGEGKSFIASNLAVSIAQNINEHVLLMDCDIRKPSIHRLFGFDGSPGLADFLRQKVQLSDIFAKTNLKKLSIIPGGKPPHNPAELLSSKEMSSLLKEVRERYRDRYIIIDSPPPQLTAETSAIARQVDGIVVVIKYGSTPREMVADLIEVLGKEKILGCVMNCFDLRSSSYYGYGKYGKYGKYYAKKPG